MILFENYQEKSHLAKKVEQMKNICIFYPDKKIGGGPYWLVRLANELAKDKQYNVYYVDYKDGFSRTIPDIKESQKVRFIEYKDNCSEFLLTEECLIFMPIYEVHKLPLLNPNSQILFHNWHNECLPVLKRVMHFSQAELKYFMSEVFAHNAQVFVDGSHRLTNNTITGLPFGYDYVSLIVPPKTVTATTQIINNNEINIAILGRVVPDKVHAINNVIAQAAKYRPQKKINIHIIGDGISINQINKNAASNISVKLCGILTDDKLNTYLSSQVDALFAMGTSVLEGAALKLPSFIIPSEMKSFDSDTFTLLSETTDMVLGFYPNQQKELKLKTMNFKTIINNIYNKGYKEKYGSACFSYIKKKHSPAYVASCFKKQMSKSSLQYSSVYNFLQIQKIKNSLENCDILNSTSSLNLVYKYKFCGLPLLKIKKKRKAKRFYLFSFLPFLKIKTYKNKKTYKFFSLLTIRATQKEKK